MATLFNTKIKDTYQSLLKLEDNTILTTTTKNVTDGLGNASPLFMSTTRVGIGTNNPIATLDVNGAARINGALTLPQNNAVFLTVGTFTWFADGNNILRLVSGGLNRLNLGTDGVLTTNAYYGSQIGSNTNPEAYSYSIAGNLQVDLVNRNLSNVNKNIFLAQTTGVGSVQNAPILRYFYAVKGAVTGFTSYRGIEIENLDSYFGTTSGNVMIGTTTNAGYKLDVNGTARVSGPLTVQTSGNNPLRFYSAPGSGSSSPASIEYLYNGGLSGGVRINLTYNTVNINSASGFETVGVAATFGIRTSATGSSYAFAIVSGNGTSPETEFRNGFDYDGNLIFRNNSTIKTISLAYAVGGTLNVQGGQPRSDFPNGSGGNLAINGGLGTGAGTPGSIIFSTSTALTSGSTLQTLSEKMRVNSSGNVLIGTNVDTGFRLEVAGDIRGGLLRLSSLTGGGTAFIIVDDNGTVIRSAGWNYDRVTLNTWVNGSQQLSSALTLNSTTTGFLAPRMTTTQKNAIASPATGLQVFDITMNAMCEYNGTAWRVVSAGKQTINATTGATTIDLSAGNVADVTLTLSTVITLTNPTVGTYVIKLIQDAIGGKVVSWPFNVLWSGGTPPTLTATANKTDVITLMYDGVNYYGTYALNF